MAASPRDLSTEHRQESGWLSNPPPLHCVSKDSLPAPCCLVISRTGNRFSSVTFVCGYVCYVKFTVILRVFAMVFFYILRSYPSPSPANLPHFKPLLISTSFLLLSCHMNSLLSLSSSSLKISSSPVMVSWFYDPPLPHTFTMKPSSPCTYIHRQFEADLILWEMKVFWLLESE